MCMMMLDISKRIIFSIANLVFISFSSSQVAQPLSTKITSPNKEYSLIISGRFYEGFAGDQNVILCNSRGDTLWNKIINGRGFSFPAISNEGKVSIRQLFKLYIYNYEGTNLGTWTLEKGHNYVFLDDEPAHFVQGFDADGKRLYFYIREFNTTKTNLVCLSDFAKSLWTTDLGDYQGTGLLFFRDLIITYDLYCAHVEYVNSCRIFNMKGQQIWRYDIDLKKPLTPEQIVLDDKNGTLRLNGPFGRKSIDLLKLD